MSTLWFSDEDILLVEVGGRTLLMSGLAVRLAKFEVQVLDIYWTALNEGSPDD